MWLFNFVLYKNIDLEKIMEVVYTSYNIYNS